MNRRRASGPLTPISAVLLSLFFIAHQVIGSPSVSRNFDERSSLDEDSSWNNDDKTGLDRLRDARSLSADAAIDEYFNRKPISALHPDRPARQQSESNKWPSNSPAKKETDDRSADIISPLHELLVAALISSPGDDRPAGASDAADATSGQLNGEMARFRRQAIEHLEEICHKVESSRRRQTTQKNAK